VVEADARHEDAPLDPDRPRCDDWTVAPLDILPAARDIVGDRIALCCSGGVRCGTDLL
jgi:isopentenyl diphosphate isomerase/L-lactate dehydrogenase-like FMN-dependent dehydrogenase